jgi:hypothetical protein
MPDDLWCGEMEMRRMRRLRLRRWERQGPERAFASTPVRTIKYL